jgi:RND family efflux transporter MFP subunit
MTMARKALADAVVRAPFDGIVDERLVSVGDYVIRGTKVASVMRTTPLRVELTVPGQYLSSIAAGRSVSLEVDAYPGKTFTGQVRYVSPAVRVDSRALVIEAVVPNESGELKPGLFATARIEQANRTPAVLVPASAIRTDAGVARVFLVSKEGTAEERIVTTGQTVDGQIELTSGIKAGDTVATSNVDRIADGVRITRGP